MTQGVALQSITAETVRSICALAVADDQQRFVAPNAVSLAQALFTPEAWYRAIYVGEEPAGFVMLRDDSLRPVAPAAPRVSRWRLMVDARFQGQGVGRAALELIVVHVRSKRLFSCLRTSYVPGIESPEGFYRAFGFRPTGQVVRGEIERELELEGLDA